MKPAPAIPNAIAISAALLMLMTGCSSDPTLIGTSDMWARPTAPDASVAAFYGTLTNKTDATIFFDEGYSRSCDEVEIHQSTTSDGVVSMSPADPADLEMEPGEQLVLEPMGMHVMCIGLVEPLVAGTPISLELTFDGAGAVVTEVTIEQR